MLLGPWISRLSRYNVRFVTSTPTPEDLLVLRDLMAAGKIVPFIDRCYPLSEVPEAIRRLEQRQVQGKVTINLQLP